MNIRGTMDEETEVDSQLGIELQPKEEKNETKRKVYIKEYTQS